MAIKFSAMQVSAAAVQAAGLGIPGLERAVAAAEAVHAQREADLTHALLAHERDGRGMAGIETEPIVRYTRRQFAQSAEKLATAHSYLRAARTHHAHLAAQLAAQVA